MIDDKLRTLDVNTILFLNKFFLPATIRGTCTLQKPVSAFRLPTKFQSTSRLAYCGLSILAIGKKFFKF